MPIQVTLHPLLRPTAVRWLAWGLTGLRAGRVARGAGRKGRPLQAAQCRGRPARQDRSAEAVRGLQRQRRGHQRHDGDPRRAHRSARDARRLSHRGRDRLGGQAGDVPAEARWRRRIHRRRGRAARVRRQDRHGPLRDARGGAAAPRRERRRRDQRQPRHLRQHLRSVQRLGRRDADGQQPGRTRSRGADAARRDAGCRSGCERRGARSRICGPARHWAKSRESGPDAPPLARAEPRGVGRPDRPRRRRSGTGRRDAGRRAGGRAPAPARGQGPAEGLRRADGRQGRAPRGRQRRGRRPARPERRRQDDQLLHDRRPGPRRRRRDHDRGRAGRAPADPPALAARPVVPAAGSVDLPQADACRRTSARCSSCSSAPTASR